LTEMRRRRVLCPGTLAVIYVIALEESCASGEQ
jgi:hypothetical protein